MTHLTRALVLGDGDGRFLAALFTQNPAVNADAVDTSAAMLKLLRCRCEPITLNALSRLQTHHADALTFLAAQSSSRYDLVATHFFLDCLTQSEVEALAVAVSARLTPDAIWLISDFRIPSGILHFPAKVFVGTLYLAFRILTGLRTNRLPDHSSALLQAGFIRSTGIHSLFGLLTAELWTLARHSSKPSPLYNYE